MRNEKRDKAYAASADFHRYTTRDGHYTMKENGMSCRTSRIVPRDYDCADTFDCVAFIPMTREEFRSSELYENICRVASMLTFDGRIRMETVADNNFIVICDENGEEFYRYGGWIELNGQRVKLVETVPEIGRMPIEMSDGDVCTDRGLHFGDTILTIEL